MISCSCRPELEREARDDPWLEFRGVKKRVKRFGVIGGGLFCLRVAAGAGGEEENSSGVGSWNATRGAQGEDMADSGAISCCTGIYREIECQLSCHTQRRNTQSQTRERDMGWNDEEDIRA